MAWLLVICPTFEGFPTGGTLLPIVLALGMVAVWAWRRLGYERHVRRIAEIERRIAPRSAQDTGA